ncbi:MAG TPA: hypothetical protein VGF07_07820 [Stellaceae bacterium]|jgi:hypothetical protein
MVKMAWLVDEFVKEAAVDYIALPQISVAARTYLGARTTNEARAKSFEVIRQLYDEGLRPGDYFGDEILYWPDEGCQAMLDRIEREWIAAGEDPNLGEPICWFGLPDKQG